MKKTKEFILETIEKFLFAFYGGFIGAVLGLYATGNHTGKQVWFLTLIYGVFVLGILLILNNFKEK